ncbi:unnamed protein product [Cuscuta epithymum]|uniref:DUF3615 domain-containing protein n=1 Tax=Cuscuta epithymum TaxID=186058 RepID=A0AAV0CP95_9ASTE|nr:unnamed protein product [Cuscuta epithymum]CAH9126271.1 unnamed protein product [Cuscuta epithymum]
MEEHDLDPIESRKLPRNPPRYAIDGIYPKDRTLFLVETALSSFNDTIPDQQGPEYELVDALGCVFQFKGCIFHFNFVARPKNGTDAENMLFFAEVKPCSYKKSPTGLRCTLCCILRPWDPQEYLEQETGLNGCNLLCKSHPGLIQHPLGGGFTKQFEFGCGSESSDDD